MVPHAYDQGQAEDLDPLFDWADRQTLALFKGVAGSSPYLRGLILKEHTWLRSACEDPEGAVEKSLNDCVTAPFDQTSQRLRLEKGRIALLTALCDLSGAWPLETVTHTLTRFADIAVQQAMSAALHPILSRGAIPGLGSDDLDDAGGMFVLAMGKMGAHELNYSSDIDLICLFDETRFGKDDIFEARAGFVKATRNMCKTLSEVTSEGYVFRTDLRLRPDPSVTPVCLAMGAAERYYESLGRAWERAAHVKARVCAGDRAAGQRYLRDLKPFVWRKHLDFAAIQDAHDMRLKIREHKGFHGPITLDGHNMKLGRGGIREIEFFTQTRQVIAGGRDPDLRVKGTVVGLNVLAHKGWLERDVADMLSKNYRFYRMVEHRLQMIADAQTHDLPSTPDGFDRLAALMGRDTAGLQSELQDRLESVHALMEEFFEPHHAKSPADQPAQFEDSPIAKRWPSYAALRSERAMEIFNRLRPEILSRLEEATKPDEALLAFDGFLAGLPAGVQIFSLFESNPQLIDLLVDIASVSSDLARFLSRNSSVFDAVIGGDFFASWPGKASLLQDLTAILAAEADYERKLDLARRWNKDWHFRIGVHVLRGLISASEAGTAYAELAETCIAALWPVVTDNFATKHGPQPGRGAVVMAMGSLGAGRLHARSDLDVIVIYDPADADYSEGPKPLPSRTYYARLTQSLITAMTAQMAEGRLYEMDMRLRPSGKKGPLAVSWSAFQTYQQEVAWTWEHMALTRSRVVAGSSSVARDVSLFRELLLSQPKSDSVVLKDLAEMRARIQSAKQGPGPWDAKLGIGRMQDIELFAQALSLISTRTVTSTEQGLMSRPDLVASEDAKFLNETYENLWALQIAGRLICDEVMDPQEEGAGARAFMLRITNAQAVDKLAVRLAASSEAAGEIIYDCLPDIEDGTQ